MNTQELQRIEMVVNLTLARLEIVKLKHANMSYDWSMVDTKGQAIIDQTLIDIDQLLNTIQPKPKTPEEALDQYYDTCFKRRLLSIIECKIDDLNEQDADGHIWWGRFKELVNSI